MRRRLDESTRRPHGRIPPAGQRSHALPGARWRRFPAVGLLLLAAALLPGAHAQEQSIGSAPPPGMHRLPEGIASMLTQEIAGKDARNLPLSLDWRDAGIISPAKSQRDCGGCWAFAAIACIEAMCVLEGADPALDLSEQQALSCDVEPYYSIVNQGCCGGTATVFEFYRQNAILSETSFPYDNGDYDGGGPRSCVSDPPWNTVPCPTPSPTATPWHVATWALIDSAPTQLKTALQEGPVWLGYDVYADFYDYWLACPDPDVPYRHVSDGSSPLGQHAVLLIGYDDEQQCWIVKNSWGRGGPFQDGTFLMDYDGNCNFGMDPVKITVEADQSPVRYATVGSIHALFR